MLRKNSWLLVGAAVLVALLLVSDSSPAPGPRPGPRLSWYERAVLWVLRRREPTPAPAPPLAEEATDEFLEGNQPPSYVAGQIKHGDGW